MALGLFTISLAKWAGSFLGGIARGVIHGVARGYVAKAFGGGASAAQYRRFNPDSIYTTANLVRGKGRFNRVDMYRRVFVRFQHGRYVSFANQILNVRDFRIATQRTLRNQTIPYLERKTPARTGKLRGSLDSNVKILSVRSGYLEVRYDKDRAYYGRWVARARDLLSSQALLNRMRKAFREGAVASQD